jgi:RNA recognition motif-containing protein
MQQIQPQHNQNFKFQSQAVRPVPCDQENPPCNTLYVGNLPMDAMEDELRGLFAQCRGYRRMLFKVKSNGPMCFVEFDTVAYATQSMNDLYGYPLSNSTKGKLI